MWWVTFITKKSHAQTKHTEHNRNLCSVQIASSQEDILYNTNVCRKGWLLTLAAGLTRKKTSQREILPFAVLGNTVWGWKKVCMRFTSLSSYSWLLLGKNVKPKGEFVHSIFVLSTYKAYYIQDIAAFFFFLHLSGKSAVYWYCSNCTHRAHTSLLYNWSCTQNHKNTWTEQLRMLYASFESIFIMYTVYCVYVCVCF